MKWTEDEFGTVMALNLGSVWHLSRAAAKPMLAAGQGRHRQHLLGRQPAGHAAGGALRRGQGGRQQPDRVDGRGLDPQGRAGQCHRLRRRPRRRR